MALPYVTPNQVKPLEEKVNNKQDALVSGVNIKTINNESILGSGNISISSGTEVTANPTLAGTEANLTGLQVGDTKYKVPQGGDTHLWENIVIIKGSNSEAQSMTITFYDREEMEKSSEDDKEFLMSQVYNRLKTFQGNYDQDDFDLSNHSYYSHCVYAYGAESAYFVVALFSSVYEGHWLKPVFDLNTGVAHGNGINIDEDDYVVYIQSTQIL